MARETDKAQYRLGVLLTFRRVIAIAATTLTELTRLRVFYVLLLFALVLIGSSVFMARLSFQQEFHVLKDVSLGAMSIFTSVLAIIASARLLSQDIDDRTAYTILAKAVPRFEYLLGKLLGVLLLLVLSIAIMAALFFAVLYLREHSALAAAAQNRAARDAIRADAFNPHLLGAILMIFIKGAVLSAVTLFISTFATSTVFTIVVAVFVHFIGHLQSTAREFWLQEHSAGWLARTFLALVALIFPDLQLFDFADQVVNDSVIPVRLFIEACALGAFYVVIYLLLAIAVFARREL